MAKERLPLSLMTEREVEDRAEYDWVRREATGRLTYTLTCGRIPMLVTDNEFELIGFLKAIIEVDIREAFSLAIVRAREDVSYELAREIVDDILGRPSISQIVKGLIR